MHPNYRLRRIYEGYYKSVKDTIEDDITLVDTSTLTRYEDIQEERYKRQKTTDNRDELDTYLGLTAQRRKNAAAWWTAHFEDYPNLGRLALDYLAIPATSVPSERLFSRAGWVYSCRRKRMTAVNAAAQITLGYWWGVASGGTDMRLPLLKHEDVIGRLPTQLQSVILPTFSFDETTDNVVMNKMKIDPNVGIDDASADDEEYNAGMDELELAF